MAGLVLHGDYRRVLGSLITDADIATITPSGARWGIGLGAPGSGPVAQNNFGEVLLAGKTAAFLPTMPVQKAVTSNEAFPSGFFAMWNAQQHVCYYCAPGQAWSFAALLEQIFSELSITPNGCMYAFTAIGKTRHIDVQALTKSPLASNRPADRGAINSAANYPQFLRRATREDAQLPFVAVGVFFRPSLLGISRGTNLLTSAFGKISSPNVLVFHAHAALLNNSVPLDLFSFKGPSDVAQGLQGHRDQIETVEHVLPGFVPHEARLFITQLSSIVKYRG